MYIFLKAFAARAENHRGIRAQGERWQKNGARSGHLVQILSRRVLENRLERLHLLHYREVPYVARDRRSAPKLALDIQHDLNRAVYQSNTRKDGALLMYCLPCSNDP